MDSPRFRAAAVTRENKWIIGCIIVGTYLIIMFVKDPYDIPRPNETRELAASHSSSTATAPSTQANDPWPFNNTAFVSYDKCVIKRISRERTKWVLAETGGMYPRAFVDYFNRECEDELNDWFRFDEVCRKDIHSCIGQSELAPIIILTGIEKEG
jgi:hypothetical protein